MVPRPTGEITPEMRRMMNPYTERDVVLLGEYGHGIGGPLLDEANKMRLATVPQSYLSMRELPKAQEVLGYRPRVTIQQGLVRTLAWYRRSLGKNVKLPPPRPSSVIREQTE